MKKIVTHLALLTILIIRISAQTQCPDNCNGCDSTSSTCFACNQDYELSILGKCVTNIVDKCIMYGPNNQCFVCQPTYALSGNTCLKQYDGCLNQNTLENQCSQCGFGKVLNNNTCVGAINCQNPDAICQGCASGFELRSDGKCYDISDGCQVPGTIEGVCATCKTGYKLIGYRCIMQEIFIPNCYIYYNNSFCEICKIGYSFFQNYCLLPTQIQAIQNGTTTMTQIKKDLGIIDSNTTSIGLNLNSTNNVNQTSAIPAIVNCSNQQGSVCITCINGYIVSNNICIPIDPNCNFYDTTNGSCLICANGYYPSSQGKCWKLNANCLYGNVTTEGVCAQCNTGYSLLQNGTCQLIIPNCVSIENNLCQGCNSGYYLKNNSCIKVSVLCNGYNFLTGDCLSCFTGYTLTNGTCSDSNCLIQNGLNCTQCKTNFRILSPSTLCTFYDSNCLAFGNNVCQTCLVGYAVGSNGLCEKIQTQTINSSTGISTNNGGAITIINSTMDPNCKVYNNSNCITCSNRYYFNADKRCIQVSAQCSSYNSSSGACTSCYQGYSLVSGACLPSASSDPYCRTRDNVTNACVDCFVGYWLNITKCTILNPLCQASNLTNGQCIVCYPGYVLSSGNCTIAIGVDQTTVSKQIDLFCINITNNTCTKCASGFYLNSSAICHQLDPLCKTPNTSTGECIECYQGYVPSGKTCVIPPQLPYCLNANLNGTCIQCINGYYSKNGTCVPVSILCGGHYDNITGQCTGCIDGYFLQGGSCIYPALGVDSACQHYTANGFCDRCSIGYYLLNYRCSQIDSSCTNFDYTQSICIQCSNSKTPQGARCV